ncbi:hypothetical protein V0P10_00125 [Burkholderia stagnalis]
MQPPWASRAGGGRDGFAQQSAYDLWQARAKGMPKVTRAQART